MGNLLMNTFVSIWVMVLTYMGVTFDFVTNEGLHPGACTVFIILAVGMQVIFNYENERRIDFD
jgi:hypothetical protein